MGRPGRPDIPGMGKDFRLREQGCPSCGMVADTHAGAGHDNKPKAGDATVCLYCTAVLLFDNDLSLVATTVDELPEEMRASMREAIEMVKRYQKGQRQ